MIRRIAPILAVAALFGCSAAVAKVASTPSTAPPASSTATELSPPPAPAPTAMNMGLVPPPTVRSFPAAYVASASEVDGAAKELAARVVQRFTNYDVGSEPDALAAAITDDPGRRRRLASTIEPLVDPAAWSRGTIVYPQMGGLKPDRASVMVVARRQVGRGSAVELSDVRTFDVRLARVDGAWSFDALASIGGEPVERPNALTPDQLAVLDDPRIELADSARWDIYRGAVKPSLLRLMHTLAERTPYSVTVIDSGHPVNVFETDRRSAHNVGGAIDIYRLAGDLVVESGSLDSLAYATASWLFARSDLVQIGAPWDLAAGDRSFTDLVHHDHLHVAA